MVINQGAGRNNDKSQTLTNPKIRIDNLDAKIIKELFNDPNSTTTAIADKLHESLSTIQRRRAKLEQFLIKRAYTIDITKLGWRTADLSISVTKGVAKETAQKLVSNNKDNVIVASLRIGDPVVDIMAEVFYESSVELHGLIESVKKMPNVIHVEWSEIVETTENNMPFMIDRILAPRLS